MIFPFLKHFWRIFFCMSLFSAILVIAESKIVHISNVSQKQIVLNQKICVGPGKINFSLDSGVRIPFISIERYKDNFLHDKPYFPESALIIETLQGRIALWQSEMGIMHSLELSAHSYDECVPRQLISRKALAASLIRLLLIVDKQGNIALKKIVE